jgi:hypothetical protein
MLRGRGSVDGAVKNSDSHDQDVALAIAELQSRESILRCVAANLPFGVHRYLNRPPVYFTFVREPVARCISHWYFSYAGRHDGGAQWQRFAEYNFEIDRIIDNGGYLYLNDQVRMITGTQKVLVGREEYEEACERIASDFLLVGTVDHFDACTAWLGHSLRWKTRAYRSQNVGDKSNTAILPPNAREKFRDANEWDLKLYEWVTSCYLPKRLEQSVRSPAAI